MAKKDSLLKEKEEKKKKKLKDFKKKQKKRNARKRQVVSMKHIGVLVSFCDNITEANIIILL